MRNVLLIILAVGLLGLFGCTTTESGISGSVEKPPKQPEESSPVEDYEAVEQALRQGDSQEALDSLEEYQEDHPADLNAQVLYATLLMSQGDIDKARGILEEVLEAAPDHREALFNLALLEGFVGNREKQLSLLEGLKEMDPEDGDVHAALGDFYLAGEEKALAKAAFTLSLELDEENISALTGLGGILLLEKEYEAAEAKLLKAVELFPADPFVYTDLSRTRIALGRYEEAREDLDRAVDLAPENYWIRMDRAKLLLNKLLKAEDALKDLDKAVEINPDYFYAYIFRGGIYDETNRRDEAIADYRKLMELRPDYYFGYRSLGTLLYMEGGWEEARGNFEKAFEYEADFGFKLLTGLTFYREGNPDRGKAYLQQFLDTIPREDHFYAVTRMCIDPGYEIFALRAVNEEKDLFIQTRMKFYIGAVMQAHGGDMLAADYYFQVRDRNLMGLYERKIALKELEAFGETGE